MNWPLLANSFLMAGLSTFLAVVLGLAFALAMTALPRLARKVLLGLSISVLALPSFLVTNCWIDLLGTNGLLHRWIPLNVFSLGGSVWILTLLLWPIPALAIWSAWQKLERVQFEVDGALRGTRLAKYLLLPAAKSEIAVSAAVVFSLALSNFSVPTILQVKVFTSEMWIQFNTNLDASAALKLSWPLILTPILLLFFVSRLKTPWPRESRVDVARAARRQLGGWFTAACVLSGGLLAFSLVTPLVQLVATSRTWSELGPAFMAGRAALFNSVLYSVMGAAAALLLGVTLARVRGLGWLWLLFFLPGVLLGIGALTLFNRPALELISGGVVIVILVLALRYVALARAVSRAALLSVDTELTDSAKIDGAHGWALFRSVLLPQIAAPLAASAYFIFLLCLWDVETILLVLPPGGETLAVRIFNLLHYGHNAHVNALCLILLLLAVAPLLVFAFASAVKHGRERSRQSALDPNVAACVALAALVAFICTGCRERTDATANSAALQSSVFSRAEIIGSRGTGAGQFNKPRSLTVDANDNLFVVDMTGRVQKFSPDGKFLLSWQMPQTDLGKPKGMCRDRDGNIVVIEPHYQRVSHFTPEGKLVAQWGVKGTNAGELTLPRAVAVDTKNNVIVGEYTLVDRVQKFSAQGQRVLAAWGVPGLAPGQFNRAEGVCVDLADRIYVADSCNHRVQVFSPEGKFLRAHGRAGTAAGEMSYPYDIQVDQQGRQFVCEFGNSRIQVFDANNRPVEIIGRAGGAPGEFNNPWSIALDSKGNLYVADSQNHRVQKLIRKKNV